MDYWVLNEDHSVRAVSFDEWTEWSKEAYATREGFEKKRRVKKTEIDGDTHVSTVFLGMDHSFTMKPPPILFETMVFGGEFDQEQERYSTWDEAVAGHDAMVAKVMGQA